MRQQYLDALNKLEDIDERCTIRVSFTNFNGRTRNQAKQLVESLADYYEDKASGGCFWLAGYVGDPEVTIEFDVHYEV